MAGLTSETLGIDEPRPVFGSQTEVLHDRIVTDIGGFLLEFRWVADAVVEGAVLPENLMVPGMVFLPLTDRAGHRRGWWKGKQRVEMVGHQQKETAVPAVAFVIKPHRLEQDGGAVRSGEWPLPRVIQAETDVIGFAVGNPRRRAVMQFQLWRKCAGHEWDVHPNREAGAK